MINTRDAVSSGHSHISTDEWRQIMKDGPCYSQTLANAVLRTENMAIMTDSVPCCEWQSNEPFYQEENVEQLYAATGIRYTVDELMRVADRARLLFRAVLTVGGLYILQDECRFCL